MRRIQFAATLISPHKHANVRYILCLEIDTGGHCTMKSSVVIFVVNIKFHDLFSEWCILILDVIQFLFWPLLNFRHNLFISGRVIVLRVMLHFKTNKKMPVR